MSQWELVQNVEYSWRKPIKLSALCHDGTPFLTVKCSCGSEMHMHESQVRDHAEEMIGSACKGCGDLLTFPPGTFKRAFARMRSDGWLD